MVKKTDYLSNKSKEQAIKFGKMLKKYISNPSQVVLITKKYSDKNRAKETAHYILQGYFGTSNYQIKLTESQRSYLNIPFNPSQEFRDEKNKSEKMKILVKEYGENFVKSGYTIAKQIIADAKNYMEKGLGDELSVSGSHDTVLKSVYLALTGKPFSVQNLKATGFDNGSGVIATTKGDKVTIDTVLCSKNTNPRIGKSRSYSIPTLEKNIENYLAVNNVDLGYNQTNNYVTTNISNAKV